MRAVLETLVFRKSKGARNLGVLEAPDTGARRGSKGLESARNPWLRSVSEGRVG